MIAVVCGIISKLYLGLKLNRPLVSPLVRLPSSYDQIKLELSGLHEVEHSYAESHGDKSEL